MREQFLRPLFVTSAGFLNPQDHGFVPFLFKAQKRHKSGTHRSVFDRVAFNSYLDFSFIFAMLVIMKGPGQLRRRKREGDDGGCGCSDETKTTFIAKEKLKGLRNTLCRKFPKDTRWVNIKWGFSTWLKYILEDVVWVTTGWLVEFRVHHPRLSQTAFLSLKSPPKLATNQNGVHMKTTNSLKNVLLS